MTESQSVEYGIIARQIGFLTHERKLNPSRTPAFATLARTPSQAAAQLPKLKALVVLAPAAPYLAYNWRVREATLANPIELIFATKYLTGTVLGVVIYLSTSGEIVARLPADFGLTEPSASIVN